MSEFLKRVRVRKIDTTDFLSIIVSVEKRRFGKYDVRWVPEGGVATVMEFDEDQRIYKDKKKDFDDEIKNIYSEYNSSRAGAYLDQYSTPGPAIKYELGFDGKYVYGFNQKTWTEGDAFINEAIKIMEAQDKTKYEIIQDYAWDKPPLTRKYGFDPYYLENSAKVIIHWTLDGLVAGGREWSNNQSGTEREESALTGKKRYDVKKYAQIFSPDGKEMFYLEEGSFTKELKWKVYEGAWDTNILIDIVDVWEKKIPGYKMRWPMDEELLVTYKPSGITPYKSPFGDQTPPPTPPPQTASASAVEPTIDQVKLNIVLPDELIFKERTDLPKFTVFVGEIQKTEDVFENVTGDDSLDEEYAETEFVETNLNSVDDEPIGMIYDNDVSGTPGSGTPGSGNSSGTPGSGSGSTGGSATDKSAVGKGPDPGSKLLYKSGANYFLFNAGNGLAGHRLKNILTDLTKYLNDNGFAGAKLGNNGVMRDLVASTYPSSPARAVASLHGAGLAIDVTFNIPGKKWTGIGDNANLAEDAKLTQVIAKWIAGQGDLTWGAQWGGSSPSTGVVKGRGITEYHHFEIKASLIANYWKPFESELSKMGFSIAKLNTTGKDGEIYKLNKVLLNSVGIT